MSYTPVCFYVNKVKYYVFNCVNFLYHFSWNVVYLENNSTIVFLEKSNDEWIEKLSSLPQDWFMISKESDFLLDLPNYNLFKIENRVLYYCREREKTLQIKSKNSLDL